jgi:hypothetical protein
LLNNPREKPKTGN